MGQEKKIILTMLLMFCCAIAFAQQNVVTGMVVDESGQPLIGAGVTTADGKKGAVTDLDGKYVISIDEKDAVLRYSFIGYASKDIVVNGRSSINVELLPDSSNVLNDVVVIGYGSTRKADLTGSVASVNMGDIADVPTTSVDQALQGKVSGVDVMSTSGEPGAATSIRIRGTRSIEASNEPLIVVDGVMDAVGDLSEINPDDIESISILKDASSTAIYGSRGANGVVMITTKKGATSRPVVVAKATFGVSALARKLDLMNASELLRYRNDYTYIDEYIKNPDAVMSVAKYDVSDFPHDTDWQKEITRTAFSQTANLSVSGKAKGVTYFSSLGFNNTDGIVDGSGFRRFTGRINILKDFTTWLSVALKANYTYTNENPNKANIGGTNVYTGAIYLAPYIGAYDEVNPLYLNGTNINTPRVAIDRIDYLKVRQNASISGEITLKPVKGLEIKSQNTYTPQQVHVYKYSPSTLPARYEGQGGLANRTEYDSMQLMSENTLTYKTKFARNHSFDAMVGFSASRRTINNVSIAADGIVDDNLKWNNLNAISTKEGYTNTSYKTLVVRESVYSRLNYNYKNRYYVTFTARGDGSSNFAANHKWAFFPSGAVKWNMKNEKFLQPARWLSNLALRLSAGRTGNDAIAPYSSLGIYATSTSGAVFDGIQSVNTYPSRLNNPDLTWEKTDLYNVGLDFSVLKDRLSITADLYYSATSDLLLTLKTIQSTGFESRVTNLGKTSNKGVEVTISSKNIEKRHFGWTTDFTISHNKQMVENIGHEEYVSVMEGSGYMMYGYKKGYPLNSLWGFSYEGVFHTAQEAEESYVSTHEYVSQTSLSATSPNYNTLLGRAKYKDVDGDSRLSNNDLVFLGSADPVIYGGLQNTFNIYGFKLGVYFTYSLGGKIYNYSELMMSGGYYTNQYSYMQDAWHPVRNPGSNLPRAGIGERHVPSSLQVHDASFLRLKNLNLSYNFDFTKRKKSVVRNLVLGVTAENLFLWTKYNGYDPDVSTNSENSALRRVDIGAYPSARSVVMNVQLKF